MNSNFDLTGRTAVITGGSGVIGSVIAKELAMAGVKVAVVGRNMDALKTITDQITEAGGAAIFCAADVLDKDSLEEAKKYIQSQFGKLDILINGAGGNDIRATTGEALSFFDIEPENLKKVFDLNVTGAILTTQVFGILFAEAKRGCVINISSMAAYIP
jgi:NAD(P)-dependent dehydrogenase (short-subunit alcohol dehydrogenase family)